MHIIIEFIGDSDSKKEVFRRIAEVLATERVGYELEATDESGNVYITKRRLVTRISDLDEQC